MTGDAGSNVFSSGADPSIEFMHTDGRRESLYFSRISAITETDQSGIYDEGNAK